MKIRAKVRAYLAEHPGAKRRHIMAALNITAKQADNALWGIRHGEPEQRPGYKPTPLDGKYTPHVLHTIWR